MNIQSDYPKKVRVDYYKFDSNKTEYLSYSSEHSINDSDHETQFNGVLEYEATVLINHARSIVVSL